MSSLIISCALAQGFIRFAVFLYTPDHTSPLLPPPHVVSEASPTEGGGPTSNVRSPPAYGGGDALSIQDGVASSMEANEEEVCFKGRDSCLDTLHAYCS